MGLRSRVACAILVLSCVSPTLGQSPGDPLTYDLEQIDPGLIADGARTGQPIQLSLLGRPFSIVLRASSIRSPRFELRSSNPQGAAALTLEPSRIYRGRVVGHPRSAVRLSLTPAGVRGYVRTPDDWIFIQPAPGEPHPHAHRVFGSEDLDPFQQCDCEEGVTSAALERLRSDLPAAPGSSDPPVVAGGSLVVMEIAVDADVEYSNLHGAGTQAEIEAVLNEVEGIYEMELGITLELVSTHIWTAEPDPYTSTHASTLLSEFRSYWNANNGAIDRDVAHLDERLRRPAGFSVIRDRGRGHAPRLS